MIQESTVAWNDLAFGLHGLGHCILCGCMVSTELGQAVRCRHCAEDTTPWGSIWRCRDEDTQRAAAVAFLVCHQHACRQPHREVEAAVDQQLRQRYGFG